MPLYSGEEWERILKRIEETIDEIPGKDGWWKSDTREPFIECAIEMVQHGMGLTAVYHVLEPIYTAMRGEYGD